jgi:hypothetical protein
MRSVPVSHQRRTRRRMHVCSSLTCLGQPCHLSADLRPLLSLDHWRRTNRCSPSSPEETLVYVITVHSSEAVRLHTYYCCRRSSTIPRRSLPPSLSQHPTTLLRTTTKTRTPTWNRCPGERLDNAAMISRFLPPSAQLPRQHPAASRSCLGMLPAHPPSLARLRPRM